MIIHINRHIIASNRKHGRSEPPIAVRRTRSAKAEYVHEYVGQGFRVVYRPDAPLKCGAVVWVETTGDETCERRSHPMTAEQSP